MNRAAMQAVLRCFWQHSGSPCLVYLNCRRRSSCPATEGSTGTVAGVVDGTWCTGWHFVTWKTWLAIVSIARCLNAIWPAVSGSHCCVHATAVVVQTSLRQCLICFVQCTATLPHCHTVAQFVLNARTFLVRVYLGYRRHHAAGQGEQLCEGDQQGWPAEALHPSGWVLGTFLHL